MSDKHKVITVFSDSGKESCLSKIAELAALALCERLYVSGWDLSYSLKQLKKANNATCIYKDRYTGLSLCFVNDKPIAIAIVDSKKSPYVDNREKVLFQCFVKKQYRRQGFGTLVVEALKNNMEVSTDKEFIYYAEHGIEGSNLFWDKLKISTSQ